MCRRFVLVLAVATLGSASGAQSVPTSPQPPATSPAAHASPPSTVLSVVVEDQAGLPVRGLKAQNFRVTEGGAPQTTGRFEEFSSHDGPLKAPPLPSLPPGTFTNYTPLPPGETLNILLIDALNTPLKGEGFIRSQLLQYVRHANPNTRLAIFGLANHLILLQGFTSDPLTLRDVVERKLIPRMPASVDPSLSSASSTTIKGSVSAINVAANLRTFEGALDGLETDFRVPLTLDAFNTLAHYLAAFPGRKNLIWFSASFPFNIVPDPSLQHPFRVEDAEEAELRETVALLSKAQVAVYPVDARSLITQSAGKSTAAGQVHAYELGKMPQSPAAEHSMMDAIAASTGGRAFYDATSLSDAVHSAVAAGSNYYSLTYTADGAEKEASYRPVHVDMTGVDAGQHFQLSYRRGELNDASTNPPSQDRGAAYAHAAMRRGGPAPEDLLFRVRVLPASATTDTVLAPDNQLDPDVPEKGPFRRYDVDFLSLPSQVIFTQQLDGHRVAKVDFLADVYDIEGNLLDAAGQTLTIQPSTNDEARLARSFIHCHLEVSVPDRAETFLRIAMRDATSNRVGVVEIPTSIVSFLPPATYARAAPATPKPAGR